MLLRKGTSILMENPSKTEDSSEKKIIRIINFQYGCKNFRNSFIEFFEL